jgi:hypothetical protein
MNNREGEGFGLERMAARARNYSSNGVVIPSNRRASYVISLQTKLSTLVDVDTCARYTDIRHWTHPLYNFQCEVATLSHDCVVVRRDHCRGVRYHHAYPRSWEASGRL